MQVIGNLEDMDVEPLAVVVNTKDRHRIFLLNLLDSPGCRVEHVIDLRRFARDVVSRDGPFGI